LQNWIDELIIEYHINPRQRTAVDSRGSIECIFTD